MAAAEEETHGSAASRIGGAAGWLPDVAGARVAGARAGMCREDEGGGGA